MRQFLVFLCLTVSLIGLSACGKYHGHYGERYYKVTDNSTQPLQVPHGMPSPVGKQLFPVPHSSKAALTQVSLLPPDHNLHRALTQQKAHKKG